MTKNFIIHNYELWSCVEDEYTIANRYLPIVIGL